MNFDLAALFLRRRHPDLPRWLDRHRGWNKPDTSVEDLVCDDRVPRVRTQERYDDHIVYRTQKWDRAVLESWLRINREGHDERLGRGSARRRGLDT